VGLWTKLVEAVLGDLDAPDDAQRPAPAPADGLREARDDVDRDVMLIASAGQLGGATVEAALAALRRLRASPLQGRALDALVARHASRPLVEPIALAVAHSLVDRGEPSAALRMVANATSAHALLLTADLHAERGDLASAVATCERVLLRELDHPGARERHRRWRAALGLAAEPDARRPDAGTTTVVTSEPDAPYVLVREVGRGGAGAVYEAEDRELGRRIALKVYHDPSHHRAQLTHEANVAAALAGPGVLRVFDVDPGHGWIALDWAPAGSIRDRVRARDASLLAPMARWALPLAATLARVHAAGWVHLDVKPANVLLAADGAPLLADFGTARRAGEATTPGSFGYVSPERLAGRAADPRDDVYGFGRLLEDVLHGLAPAAPRAGLASLAERWYPLAQACVAKEDTRLADGAQIATRIRTELMGA